MDKKDEVDLKVSQGVLKYLRNKTRWDWARIANLIGVSERTLRRIKKGEVGLSLQQLLTLKERMGPEVLSIPEDASPEVKELYKAYRFMILE